MASTWMYYGDDWTRLQEALAFVSSAFDLDDQPIGDVFIASDSPTTFPDLMASELTSLAPSSTPDKRIIKPKAYPRKRGTSRKQEVLHLRDEVKFLEVQLVQLRERRNTFARQPIAASLQVSLWKDVATRQLSQRQLSEDNNTQLRTKLAAQIRMAKSLMRTLHKRSTELVSHRPKTVEHPERTIKTPDFDGLLLSMENMYLQSDDVLAHSPVASLGNPLIRRDEIKHTRLGQYIEFHDCRFVPFSLEIASRSKWRFLRESSSPTTVYNDDRRDGLGNNILRSFDVEITTKKGSTKMQGHQVMKQFFQEDSVVIVRRAVVRPIAGDTSCGTFIETGWMRLKSLPGESATLLQGFSTILPQTHGAVIPDWMVAPRKAMEERAFQVFENILFEEAAKQ